MKSLFQIERFATEIPSPCAVYLLPYPPSVNNYWRSRVVPGIKAPLVYVSKEGKQYRAAVVAILREVCKEKLSGRLSVEMLVTFPDRRARDCDNLAKSCLDSLTHGGAWGDDSQIDRLVIARAGVQKPGGVEVRIAVIGDAP